VILFSVDITDSPLNSFCHILHLSYFFVGILLTFENDHLAVAAGTGSLGWQFILRRFFQ
jgi:hypothetical protein